MNVRVIPRAAVDGYLRLVRVPVDTAIRLLPGGGDGVRSAATLAVDRADAAVRATIASLLRDEALREDAQLRHEAARKRGQAVRLRDEADRTAERADTRLRQRQAQTTRQRTRADERAQSRRREANRKQESRERAASETERERLDTSHAVANEVEAAIEQHAPEARLNSAETRNEALRQKEKEMAARDEARRMREAAERTKLERKSDAE